MCVCAQLGPTLLRPPWTVVHQAPLSMGFSRQEYWSGVPLPSPPFRPIQSDFQGKNKINKPKNRLFWWLGGKESACQYGRCGFVPWVRKVPRKRKWQPTPVFLPGESHGQRSLVYYSPWGSQKSWTQLSTHTHKSP